MTSGALATTSCLSVCGFTNERLKLFQLVIHHTFAEQEQVLLQLPNPLIEFVIPHDQRVESATKDLFYI